MPSSKGYKRDYAQENLYKRKPEQIAKRVKRNAARRKALASGKVRLGDGMDIDHKNGNAKDNSPKNLRKVSASKNRSFPRTRSAKKVNKSD